MTVKVYSAAIGTKTFKNMTVDKAMHECMEMFRNCHASSYMRGNWPIDYLDAWGNPDRENVGSFYKCTTGIGGARFVKLVSVEWNSFSYVSAYFSEPGRDRNIYELREELDRCAAKKRMDFTFEKKGSDTVATIQRREQGEISWWEDLTDKLGDLAADNLSFILKSGGERSKNVQRADHLRIRF